MTQTRVYRSGPVPSDGAGPVLYPAAQTHISRFHDGLILFLFDTIAPNLVPSVSNDLVQLSEWEQMKKGTKIKNRFV